ncbi:glycosyltransferase family 87 protein [Ferruginibacter yonginensis]|uniref:Glycosyltransferase family 87 protein n=1 Tax=Ferruginibacter yonginensis TaxID=1310416 RepID=A0ABV8QPP6_9BACT
MIKLGVMIRRSEFLNNKSLSIIIWFGLVIVALALSFVNHSGINNYYIFKGVFEHTIQQKNLYLAYPEQYEDVNLYGPVFSVVIAPFAILPNILGSFLWILFSAFILYYAIQQLPISKNIKSAIIICSAVEMMNVASWFQSNAFIAACILLGFSFIIKEKEGTALFFILLATFIKLYGIVGLSFFLFSDNKRKFIFYTICWSLVFISLPLLFTSIDFIIQSYIDWYHALTVKSAKNIDITQQNYLQDISVMGMIRRIFKFTHLKNIVVFIPAVILFLIQCLYVKYYNDIRYKTYLLCSVLLMVVIFSTSAESPTYIIAFLAICLWYFLQNKTTYNTIFFIFAFVVTSFSYSDLLTPSFRIYIARPYAIKALPSFITWLIICMQVYKKQFLQISLENFKINQ